MEQGRNGWIRLKALEGRNCSRRTQLHKLLFEALVHFKCKSLEKRFQTNFICKVKKIMQKKKHINLLAFGKHETFKPIK